MMNTTPSESRLILSRSDPAHIRQRIRCGFLFSYTVLSSCRQQVSSPSPSPSPCALDPAKRKEMRGKRTNAARSKCLVDLVSLHRGRRHLLHGIFMFAGHSDARYVFISLYLYMILLKFEDESRACALITLITEAQQASATSAISNAPQWP